MKKIEKERTTERKKYVALARYVSGDISDWMMTYHLFPPFPGYQSLNGLQERHYLNPREVCLLMSSVEK
jgi:hypothetical protein